MKNAKQFLPMLVWLICLPSSQIIAQAASGAKPEILLNRHNSSNQAPFKTPVVAGDTLGWVRWRGWGGSQTYNSGAEIRAYVTGAPVGNYIPGNLVFKVGKGLPDRLIILDNGFVGVNTSTPQFALDVETDARIKANMRLGPNGKIAMKESLDKLILNPANNFANHVRVESDLEVTGTLTVANLAIANNLSVGNDAAIGHDLNVNHDASVVNDLTVGGKASVAKNLFVGQNASVASDLTVKHNTAITNDLSVGNNASVTQNFSVGQNATVTNDLSVKHNSTITNDLSVGNNAVVTKNFVVGQFATVDKDLTVNQNVSVAKDLAVGNNAVVTKNFAVGQFATVGNDLTVNQNASVAKNFTVGGRLAIGNGSFNYLGNTSNYDLMVEKNIVCAEVRVSLRSNWPDYVFDPNYSLRPLPELAQYIRANRHLPGLPAATDAEKHGIDLGDMNRKLLEKIEELTLYILEQNKRMDVLEARVQQLQVANLGGK